MVSAPTYDGPARSDGAEGMGQVQVGKFLHDIQAWLRVFWSLFGLHKLSSIYLVVHPASLYHTHVPLLWAQRPGFTRRDTRHVRISAAQKLTPTCRMDHLQPIRKIVREVYAAAERVFRHFPDRLLD